MKRWLLLPLLLASCMPAIPTSGTFYTATNAVPLDEPGEHPYVAPDFLELPAESKAGRWERIQVGTQPSASLTPDPFFTTPPDGPPGSAVPPYPPPPMSQPGGCPDPSWASANHGPPMTLSWDYPVTAAMHAWEPVLTPGNSVKLHADAYKGELGWKVSDPRIADVSADGTVTGHHAGVAVVTATSGSGAARVLVPVMELPVPAARFRFRADWGTPNAQAARGPRIFRDDASWDAFWESSLHYQLPWDPPAVDFSRFDIVGLVDDRTTFDERDPVITQISQDASVVHIAFPGLEQQGLGYHQSIYFFLTGKLAPNAIVKVHTLCNP
jgi:hypothetical protein